jgi:predicted signal transduction protein with EAL and GGDEF domain
MLRFFIILIALTLLVVLRIILVRNRHRPQKPREQHQPNIVEMPAAKTLAIKHYFFANFDHRSGPANRDNFFENLVVHVGPEDSAQYRVYSLWVVTPEALKLGHDPYRFGRGLLIVERYDMDVILRAVQDRIRELGLLAEEVE